METRTVVERDLTREEIEVNDFVTARKPRIVFRKDYFGNV